MLIVCSQCQRHHREHEGGCPFCRRRRSRGALTAAAASILVGACGGEAPTAASPAPADAPVVVVPAPEIEPSEAAEDEAAVADGAPLEAAPEPPVDDPAAEDEGEVEEAIVEVAPFPRPTVMRYGVAPRPAPPPKKP